MKDGDGLETKLNNIMTLKEAAEILDQHNKWRRDNNVPSKYEMGNPERLGIAIDIVLNHLSKFKKSKSMLTKAITEIKNVDNMYLDKKTVLTRLKEINNVVAG